MSKNKFAIDGGPLKSGDKVRGIGMYVLELTSKLKNVDVIDAFKEDLGKYKVVHFTRFNPFRVSVPFSKPKGTKFILTIYDLVPLIYPKHYPPGIRGKINWMINKYLIKKNIDEIITISETSKKDIARFCGLPPSKIHVIRLAPRPIYKKLDKGTWEKEISEKYNLPSKFAVYIGDINYNKNIPLLVKSCKIANIPLVICGAQAKEIENMDLNHPELTHLARLDLSSVIRPGFVPDEDIVKILNLAAVYIQPSLYEGFGLPLLEANAAGTAAVAAKTQSLVEMADGAALFADPKDPKDFAQKIKLLMKDEKLKKEMVAKGIANAKKYSWEKTSKETLKVYEE